MSRNRTGKLIRCCVRLCPNTHKNKSADTKFYRFSKAQYNAAQCEEWKLWIRKTNESPDWEPKIGTQICSDHFVGNRISSLPSSPSYAPSIVKRIEPEMLPEETSAIKRFERSMQTESASNQAKSGITIKSPPHINLESIELPPIPAQLDKSFQIEITGDPPEYEVTFNESITVICMHFVRNGVCEAQTQIFIPEKVIYNHTFTKKHLKHRRVGTDITRIDKSTDYDPPNLRKQGTELPTIVSINRDVQMLEICGVTIETFQTLLNILPDMPQLKKILKEDRIFLLLTKLKTGISFAGMSALYQFHRQTISKIFTFFLKELSAASEQYIQWPSREAVRNSMPEDFKQLYGNCRVMIHCMKIPLHPGGTISRVQTHADYGGSAKILVGYTPSGLISFVSSCQTGLTTDDDLIKNSGIFDLLKPGDVILANKAFPELEKDLCEHRNIVLKVIPPFLRNAKFSADEVDRMYQNARVKNHYERNIRKLKFYKILHSVSVELYPILSDMFRACCALANLQFPNVLSECKDTQYPNEDDDVEDS